MKNRKSAWFIALSFLIGALIPSPSFAQSCDWNVAMGGNPGRNGLSSALGPFVEAGGSPTLLWSGGESAPYASHPVIEGDNLIVSRRWPSNSQGEAWIINYNLYTGAERWKITLPIITHDNWGKVTGVKDGLVFAHRSGGTTEHEHLFALDIDTGDIVWMSAETYGEHQSESIAFADNGDIIIGDDEKIMRINIDDGTTVWSLPRGGSSSDGNAVAVFGSTGYFWDQTAMGMFVSACDLDTGTYLYGSDTLDGPGFQQQGLMVGPDGVVYAPLVRGNPTDALYSITDDGVGLTTNWSYPIYSVVFGSQGVGPDGSIYTYSPDEKVVRLDPATGQVINTSIVVSAENGWFSGNMAIGSDGLIYLAVDDWPFKKLYILNANLDVLWGEEIPGLIGVALGNGVLAVNGNGTEIRAYEGRPCPTVFIDGFESGDLSAWSNALP
ncbi:MAG: PQQ-binding-like beta-propeller repeat protein [Acidobacteriota bacterium]